MAIAVCVSALAVVLVSTSLIALAWFPPYCEVEIEIRYIFHDDEEGSPTFCNYYLRDENGDHLLHHATGSDDLYLDENGNGWYDKGEPLWHDLGGDWVLGPTILDPHEHWFLPDPINPPEPGDKTWWWEPTGIMSPEDTAKFNSFGGQYGALGRALDGLEEYEYDVSVAGILSNIYGGLEPDDPEDPLDLSNYQVLVQRRSEYYPLLEELTPPQTLVMFHMIVLFGLRQDTFVLLPYQNLDDNTFATSYDEGVTHLVDTDDEDVVYDIYIERSGDEVTVSGSFQAEELSPEMVEHPILILNGVLDELMM
ncbi:hypothetical protein J7J84_02150 [bacterium]|nr:hypothetical protein [bacterium]